MTGGIGHTDGQAQQDGRTGRPTAQPAGRDSGAGLSDEERAAVIAAVLALEPMTEEQIAAVCEVIAGGRARWRASQAA